MTVKSEILFLAQQEGCCWTLSGAPAKQRAGIALGWYSSEQDVREPVDDGDS
jgi:hypothetical protein